MAGAVLQPHSLGTYISKHAYSMASVAGTCKSLLRSLSGHGSLVSQNLGQTGSIGELALIALMNKCQAPSPLRWENSKMSSALFSKVS